MKIKKGKYTATLVVISIFFCAFSSLFAQKDVIYREARETLTPIEMNIGEMIKFKLKNGEVRNMTLIETSADVIITNLNELKINQPGGGTLYHFTAVLSIDGHQMKMERYVGSQESFYEPYVVNGMRIWLDAVSKISEVINKERGGRDFAVTKKDARFGLQDMSNRIAPSELYTPYANKENFIDIKESYNGADCWLGAYFGFAAHDGLDINMPNGSPNFAPFSIDNHFLFNTLANGDNNNRWRGMHQWKNGDVWTWQNHHLLNLLIPEHIPINAGVHYGDAAGVHIGMNEHAHFLFRIKTPYDESEILLDPWIIFWQSFEDNKKRAGEVNAAMAPLMPGKTGIPVQFTSKESNSGPNGNDLQFYWTFGDGGFSNEANPNYTYMNPGIFPVTLVVDDGSRKDSFTQHITIDGRQVDKPGLVLIATDEPSFRPRSVNTMDVYGMSVQLLPHTLHFVARASRPKPTEKNISFQNNGSGILSQIREINVVYSQEGEKWLHIKHKGKGNQQKLIISVDATGLSTGKRFASVQIKTPDAANGNQSFHVELSIPSHPPSHQETRDVLGETIDNNDGRQGRFFSTPYFWVAPRFKRWVEKGFNGFYLTNGGRPKEGEFARFTPDLEAGRYEVSFSEATPFEPERRAISKEGQQPVNSEYNPKPHFFVRVRSKKGDTIIDMEPSKSRVIGVFDFEEGMDGFVEILAFKSTGQVLVDAIVFKKIP